MGIHRLHQTSLGACLAAALAMLAMACAPQSTSFRSQPGQEDSPIGSCSDNPNTSAFDDLSFHRLNRAEFDNSLKDLLAAPDHTSMTYGFEADDGFGGFDNIADALSVGTDYLDTMIDTLAVVVPAALNSTAGAKAVFTCLPTASDTLVVQRACAKTILSRIGRRAYRRPLNEAEMTGLLGLMDVALSAQGDFKKQIGLALQGLFSSPSFLFRILNPTAAASTPDYVMAGALAGAVWSSVPDEALLDEAATGELTRNKLSSEVDRLLQDSRSEALVQNFASEYFKMRDLDHAKPNAQSFPDFDESLRTSMRTESEMFFRALKDENRNLNDILTSQTTFINKRLARHYGLSVDASATDAKFDRTNVSQLGRQGVMGQGTLQLALSNADSTSPVRRGKYILENFLCAPPPPPPANLSDLIPPADPHASHATGRDRLADHAKIPLCMGCHADMDALGLAFEKFDAIGAPRDFENNAAIDTAGLLKSGTNFSGPSDLLEAIKSRPTFSQCFTQNFTTYAVGQSLGCREQNEAQAFAASAVNQGFTLSSLMKEIANNLNHRIQSGLGAGVKTP